MKQIWVFKNGQHNLDELFADSDRFEGFVKAWISKLAINLMIKFMLSVSFLVDDDKWKDGDRDDDPITFALYRTPAQC